MGGFSYDRDVYSSNSSSNWDDSSASSYSASKFTSSYLDSSLQPKGKFLESKSKYPIIVLLDVTGSNIDFARVVYDKLPMFFGQIEQKGYLDDFEICFCAVGDADGDHYPLQVCNFAKGIELDSWIEKLVLEGGGGGQHKESYELAAYYLLKCTKFRKDSHPIIFFIGDERPYPTVKPFQSQEVLGIECYENVEPFKLLREKVNDNVFMLLNKYSGHSTFEAEFTNCWRK